jgi:predicted nucleotidyltransferase/DNA-binding XRE family transcriptional regulator
MWRMHTTANTGRKLVAARRAMGISQRELGERLGIKQQQIARWERTEYASATLERVEAVAHVLGMDESGPEAWAAAEDQAAYGALPTGTDPALATAVRRLGVPPAAFAAFARSHGIERLELFGSVLTDEFGPRSDVDVLVTYRTTRVPSLIEAADHELELSAMLRRRADLVSRTAVEALGRRERRDAILSTARALYAAR